MKAWRRWIAALMIASAAQVGLAKTDGTGKPQAEQTDAEISEALAEAIAQIEATFMDVDERVQQIALLIAQTTQGLPLRSGAILGDLSHRLPATDLPVVSAAAIMSSGTGSPAVLQAMLNAQGNDATRVAAVRQGATNPTAILGNELITQVQPVAVRPAAAPMAVSAAPAISASPATVPVEVAATQSVSASQPVILATPPPPQPSGPPPRPPGLVYRGQGS